MLKIMRCSLFSLFVSCAAWGPNAAHARMIEMTDSELRDVQGQKISLTDTAAAGAYAGALSIYFIGSVVYTTVPGGAIPVSKALVYTSYRLFTLGFYLDSLNGPVVWPS